MSSTPPESGSHGASTGTGGTQAGSASIGTMGSPGDLARLPIPGNAEFLFLLMALILLAIVALIADRYDVSGWITSLEILGAAYLISRGIAKASRVLEH